jgi:hypothetical protein
VRARLQGLPRLWVGLGRHRLAAALGSDEPSRLQSGLRLATLATTSPLWWWPRYSQGGAAGAPSCASSSPGSAPSACWSPSPPRHSSRTGLITNGHVNLLLGTLFWGLILIGPTIGIPLACAVAVLKYRLYEIDRIISRTLAYAIITGLLVGIYAGPVLLATQVLGIRSPAAVAGTTLVAAALFSPLRSRVQRAVDRRFNRARYDADQTVMAFAVWLKNAVDLDSVRNDLAGVVHQALEPAHISMWISQRD